MNLNEPSANTTAPVSRLSGIIKVSVVIPIFCVFLCCIGLMLHIFASHRQFMDTSRYILFAYMLIVDTLQLLTSVLLLLLYILRAKLALVYCVPLLVASSTTFKNTPVILATMSLERYVAIVYPLHCPAAWRADRIWRIILLLGLVSLLHPLIDFSVGQHDPAVDVFSTPVLCRTTLLNASAFQLMLRAVVNILFFVVVAMVIFYTYVRILLETRKLRQDRGSVNKAMHTVLLHGAQLLLCMMAFLNPVTEILIVHANWGEGDIAFFNFFCFILIPRFLSPLIYGLRDQRLRGYMRKIYLSSTPRVKQK